MAGIDGASAERYRLEGNEHFRSSRYHNAIKSYTKSLECHGTSAVLANRAQAYLNTRQYERALMDSAKALELDETNVKAMFRYAKALANLHLYEVATEKLSGIDPKNKEVTKLKESLMGKANCAELRLLCGDKDEFLRSKVPLKEIKNVETIRIQSAEEKPAKKLEVTQPESSTSEIPPPPVTSFSFIADFQAIRDRPVAFANYFLTVDRDKLGELLDEIIETEMIECLIMGFDKMANESNIAQLLECLIQLADVSRFEIAVMFLDESAKNVLRRLSERHAIDENQFSVLKVLYAL